MTPSTFLHYSVPGLPAHRARTIDLDDARALGADVAERTGTHAAILCHAVGEGGVEAVTLVEVVAPTR